MRRGMCRAVKMTDAADKAVMARAQRYGNRTETFCWPVERFRSATLKPMEMDDKMGTVKWLPE